MVYFEGFYFCCWWQKRVSFFSLIGIRQRYTVLKMYGVFHFDYGSLQPFFLNNNKF